MNSSGISRRIDDLGRIVIPVEIRRLLNIKEGENLEFIIKDNVVSLKKTNIIDNKDELINNISYSLENIIDGDYMITNRENIISSSNKKLINKSLPLSISNLLNTHDNTVVNGKDLNIKSNLYIFPYYINGSISGFVIFYNINDINKYTLLAKYICSYIRCDTTLT